MYLFDVIDNIKLTRYFIYQIPMFIASFILIWYLIRSYLYFRLIEAMERKRYKKWPKNDKDAKLRRSLFIEATSEIFYDLAIFVHKDDAVASHGATA